MNKILPIVLLVCALGAVAYYLQSPSVPKLPTDYKKATYLLEGKYVSVIDTQTPETPRTASEISTYYFGNDVRHDIDDDGTEDIVFLVQRFYADGQILYYVVAALSRGGGYVGTEGYLLGDRIAPQTTEIRNDHMIVVNYAERAQGEPISVEPSHGVSRMLKLDPVSLRWGIVAQNFEGEADPKLMKLPMKTWRWISATYNNGESITPKNPDAFMLTFKENKTFSATTDCNGVSGGYTSRGTTLTFGEMTSTLMFCENAEETVFTGLLASAEAYHFTSKGELIVELNSKSGSMIFR